MVVLKVDKMVSWMVELLALWVKMKVDLKAAS